MAQNETSQERTEEATPEKLRKSRDEGQVVRSRELMSMALISLGAVTLMLVFPAASIKVATFTKILFQAAAHPELSMTLALSEGAKLWLVVVLPFLGMLTLAGIGASLAVGGWAMSAKAISFKAERMSLIKGFKRMFSSKSVVELLKSILKFLVLSAVAVAFLSFSLDKLLNLVFMELPVAMAQGVHTVATALLLLGLVLLLIAAIDVPFQIAQHQKQLKMTKQEVKDESKNTDGRPEVKSRIRRVQQEMANRRSLDAVPEATVILTNPEHYAVALRYDPSVAAPIVVAKGVDLMALRIQEIARAHGIEVLRTPPLARAVYFNSDLGAEIPTGLYGAVAQVLAYVQQLNDYRSGQLATPPTLAPLAVPSEFAKDPE